jgi:hypothetical protein
VYPRTLAGKANLEKRMIMNGKTRWSFLPGKWTILALIVSGSFAAAAAVTAQSLHINEFMGSNSATIADSDGDYPDWIEIYNSGSQSVALQGYGLSDNAGNRFKWVFPDVNIPAGGFLLVWASGKDRFNGAGDLHTNFSISATGEPLVLTHRNGVLIDSIPPVALQTDVAYARYPDGSTSFIYTEHPTPGAPNRSEGFTYWLQAPEFSVPAGFYTETFQLEITLPDAPSPEVAIFYTLDGSEPNPDAIRYEGPISITNRTSEPNDVSMIPTNNFDSNNPYREHWRPPVGQVYKGTVVRARAFLEGSRQSEVNTASYFVDPNGRSRYGLPVISLSTDAANFFDDEIGIYVAGNHTNYSQRGDEWERPVYVEMLEADGTLVISQPAGVRIHGGTSRGRALKTLRLYARTEYGAAWFEYPLFPDKPVERYQRFLLRNSGNDWSESMLRDLFMQSLLKHPTELDIMYGRPAIVFINGEFWGIQNIRDRFDDAYLQTHYDVAGDEFTFLESRNNQEGAWSGGSTDGVGHYSAMYGLFSTDPAVMTDERVQTIGQMMDIDNFFDYQIGNIYIRNTDWPGNNNMYWRYNGATGPQDEQAGVMPRSGNVKDGRWRWMVFDTDFGFQLNFDYVQWSGRLYGGNDARHNTVGFALEEVNQNDWPNPRRSTFPLRALLANEAARQQFVNRFSDLLNSSFKGSAVVAHLDSIAGLYRPNMDEHTRRWGEPASVSLWEQELGIMRNFAMLRDQAIRGHLREELGLGAVRVITLDADPTMGHIRVNTLDVAAGLPGVVQEVYPWTGQYFEGVPVRLKAVARPGYRFLGWSGDAQGSDQEISVALTSNKQITAIFERAVGEAIDDMNPAPWLLSERPYTFTEWFDVWPTGTFPESMVFLQSNMGDPELGDPMTAPYDPGNDVNAEDADLVGFPYRLTRRTRINGLGTRGISMINTGRERDLGAAVLALDLTGVEAAEVSWTGGTETANSRVYAIRLQARVGHESDWFDVTDAAGQPVEYRRRSVNGHSERIGPHRLPEILLDKPYAQLRWKYYFTGERLSNESGARDELRLDDILIEVVSGTSVRDTDTADLPGKSALLPNVPNPFNPTTMVRFELHERQHIQVDVFDVSGRRVAALFEGWAEAGRHQVLFEGHALASGVYLVRLSGDAVRDVRKMVLVK